MLHSRAVNPPPHAEPRLLIVDDEPTIRFALKDFFSAEGYEVDCAAGLGEAETFLRLKTYALMLVDLCLTGDRLDGLELIAKARQLREAMPCVVLTAHGTPEAKAQAEALAVNAFLQKPVPLRELAALTGRLLAAAG